MSNHSFKVVVGNVGTMDYTSKKLAQDCYTTYVYHSTHDFPMTRAYGESVTLFRDEEIIAEHIGSVETEENY